MRSGNQEVRRSRSHEVMIIQTYLETIAKLQLFLFTYLMKLFSWLTLLKIHTPWINKWTNERMNEWNNERMNEWMFIVHGSTHFVNILVFFSLWKQLRRIKVFTEQGGNRNELSNPRLLFRLSVFGFQIMQSLVKVTLCYRCCYAQCLKTSI